MFTLGIGLESTNFLHLTFGRCLMSSLLLGNVPRHQCSAWVRDTYGQVA